MKIFLVGLPGSGKTTLGKKIAEKYNISFFDLDEEIIKIENRSVSEIFMTFGENYFRRKESEILLQVIKDNQQLVLATGGGTPCFFSNIKLMKESGTVIFLNTPLDIIAERLASEKNTRPLIKDSKNILEKVLDLFKTRKDFYQQAQYTVNNEQELFDTLDQLK